MAVINGRRLSVPDQDHPIGSLIWSYVGLSRVVVFFLSLRVWVGEEGVVVAAAFSLVCAGFRDRGLFLGSSAADDGGCSAIGDS